jgi:hypothetical protein
VVRARTRRFPPGLPVLRRLPDGSWLSAFGGALVRVIDAQLTIITSAGRTAARYRLVTTLADLARHPAGEVIALYWGWERWEIEAC